MLWQEGSFLQGTWSSPSAWLLQDLLMSNLKHGLLILKMLPQAPLSAPRMDIALTSTLALQSYAVMAALSDQGFAISNKAEGEMYFDHKSAGLLFAVSAVLVQRCLCVSVHQRLGPSRVHMLMGFMSLWLLLLATNMLRQ